MTFAADVRRWAGKAKARQEAVARDFIARLGTDVIVSSPVDTGRFRANWRAGIDEIDGSTDQESDKQGTVSINRVAQAAKTMKMGDVIYVTNSLHYAMKLEYGWSRQAPYGMVRVTRARAAVILSDAVRANP